MLCYYLHSPNLGGKGETRPKMDGGAIPYSSSNVSEPSSLIFFLLSVLCKFRSNLTLDLTATRNGRSRTLNEELWLLLYQKILSILIGSDLAAVTSKDRVLMGFKWIVMTCFSCLISLALVIFRDKVVLAYTETMQGKTTNIDRASHTVPLKE